MLLYIEDSLVLDDVTRKQRLDNIIKVKYLTGYSGFKIYYTLIENVFFLLQFSAFMTAC